MKLLIVIDTLGSGGAQRLKVQLAKGLVRKKHNVEFFIYDANHNFFESELVEAGIKIHIANRHSEGFSFNVIKELRKIIKYNKYDYVISSLHSPGIYSAFALFWLKKTKLIVCEESSSNASISPIKRYLFYFATLLANFVVTNSFHEFELIKKLPGRSKKTKVIWNGLDLNSIKYRSNINHLEKGISKLLVVGRVAYPKNGINLLKALSLFESRNGWLPEINWIGRRDIDKRSSKDQNSVKMNKEMDKYLANNKYLSQKWNWLGTVDDIQEHYDSSDALLSVSIYEGMPMVICEAMLSGCFVIASNVCDHPKVIGRNERGLLCDPLSPISICIAIEDLNKMDIKKKISSIERARNFAKLNFNRDKMIDQFESLMSK